VGKTEGQLQKEETTSGSVSTKEVKKRKTNYNSKGRGQLKSWHREDPSGAKVL